MDRPGTPVSIETLMAHREWVRRVAFVLVRDEDRAADLEQDLWVKVLETPPRVEGSIRGWLAATLRNGFLNRERGERRRASREAALARSEAVTSAADLVAHAELHRKVVDAVMDLDEPYRTTLLYRYYEDLPPREIAARQEIPVETVRTHLKRAVAMLRERLDAGHDGSRAAWCLALAPFIGDMKPAVPANAVGGTGAAAAGLLTTGGFLMANKALAAAAVVLLLAGTAWFATRSAPEVAPGEPSEPARVVATLKPPPSPESPAAKRTATSSEEKFPDPVDLSRCDRELDLFGEVVDEKGEPVGGATIRTLRRPWRRLSGPRFPRYEEVTGGPSTRSARDGTFSMRLDRHEVVDLVVESARFAESLLPDCVAGGRVRVTLVEGARLEVTAKDAEGRGVSGASLHFLRKPAGPKPIGDRRGVTDENGRCTLAGLPQGRGILYADHESMGSPRASIVDIPATGVVSVDLVFSPTRTLVGCVTAADTGSPIEGAHVGADPFFTHSTTTAPDGRFTVSPWPTSKGTTLFASAPGYSIASVQVPPRGDGAVDFALHRGDVVVGRLLGGVNGGPVASAKVLVVGRGPVPGGPPQMDYLDGVSDSDGSFRISGLHHSLAHTLKVDAPGHGRLVLALQPAGQAGGTIDLGSITLPSAKSISGTLVDGRGKPVPGHEISLSDVHAERQDRVDLPEYRWTDDLGRFVFTDLAAGAFQLGTWIEGEGRVRKEVTIPPEESIVEVRLSALSSDVRTITVRVRVLDPEGRPVPGATVDGIAGNQTPVTRTTGQDGVAELLPNSTPTLRIQVFPPGSGNQQSSYLRPPSREIVVDGSPVEFRLQRAAWIRGTVVGPEGKPVSGMSIGATGPNGTGGGGNTDERGAFELSVAGGVACQVSVSGWRLKDDGSGLQEKTDLRGEAQTLTAPSDGAVFVLRRIRSGQTVTIRVVDLEGRPIPGCSIFGPTEPLDGVFPVTGADGRVTFGELFEEECRFMALAPGVRVGESFPPDGAVMPAPVVAIPQGQEIVMQLRLGKERSGRVVDAQGQPAAGVNVTLQTDDYVTSTGWTGPDGRFKVWVAPDRALMGATAYHVLSESKRYVARLEGDAAPQEGEILLRLEPMKER